MLELDADHIAARNSWNYFSDLCSRGFFPALSPISPEKCWALSLNMLFRIMHAFQTDTSNPTKRTHPPPMLRNLHIAALSTDPKLPNFIGSEDVFVWGFGIVDGWWKSNNLPIPVGFDGVGSDPVEELNELRRKFHYKYTDQIREFLQVRADANER